MKYFATRIIGIISIAFLLIGYSCNKEEEDKTPPTIKLIEEQGLVSADTSIPAATTIVFKVESKSNGNDVLTNLIASSNGNRFVDEGINTHELTREISFTKNSDKIEVVVFTIRDISGGEASISVNIELDENGGNMEPVWYQNITLKAQSTEGVNSFFSLIDGTIYSIQDAYNNQTNVHLLYYFDTLESDENTVSSPGANIDASIFSGDFGLENWTTRNTLRFLPVSITQTEFESINSVLYLVEAYTTSGTRKAKNLVLGNVFSFKDESRNKYGMFRVNSISGESTGEINITIVVQP